MKIKKGDTVLITKGKDRGKKGNVLRVDPTKQRIVVEGVYTKKKHRRPRKAGEKGQIITMPSPFSISNAALLCSKCGKPARVGYRVEGEKKYRVCKKCGMEL